MADDWQSPTGHNDPDTKWTSETQAYDDDLEWGTGTSEPGHYLELTHAALYCDKVRVYAVSYESWPAEINPDITLGVYYDSDWHTIFTGAITKNTWVEKSIPAGTKSVTAMRIKENNASDGMDLWEADFNQAAEPQIVTPTTLALTDTQYAPVIGWGIVPSALALADTQYAPVLKHKIIVPVLALSDTEYAPTIEITADIEVVPSTLALVTTKYAPVIKLKVIPPTLALTITIFTPVYGGGVIPITLVLNDTEYAPTVLTPRLCTPTTLALSDTEFVPIIGWGIIPDALALTTTKYAPVIGWGIIPGTLSLSDTEYAPTIKHKIIIPLLSLILTKYAPDSIIGVIISGALGYTIEVRDGAGNLLAIFENAFGISLTQQLNRPPMLDFSLPADDSKVSHIDPDNEIWLRDYETGVLVEKFLMGRRRDKRE